VRRAAAAAAGQCRAAHGRRRTRAARGTRHLFAPPCPRPTPLPRAIAPKRLTDYLYSLSEAFNQFYTECKVVGSEQEASRMLLCEATARVMRKCFELLGMTPLYRI
jgi:hypothetical protein